eukprot:3738436-Prymnesium_polylepis.1
MRDASFSALLDILEVPSCKLITAGRGGRARSVMSTRRQQRARAAVRLRHDAQCEKAGGWRGGRAASGCARAKSRTHSAAS